MKINGTKILNIKFPPNYSIFFFFFLTFFVGQGYSIILKEHFIMVFPPSTGGYTASCAVLSYPDIGAVVSKVTDSYYRSGLRQYYQVSLYTKTCVSNARGSSYELHSNVITQSATSLLLQLWAF